MKEVERLRQEASPEDLDRTKELCTFLSRWLVYHILRTDQTMARQVEAIRQGATAAAAYEAATPSPEGPTDLLIETLQGLHGALARRNRELSDLSRSLEQQVLDRTQDLAAANEALRANEVRYRAVVDSSPDGFWILDAEGRMLEVNESYCRMSGYTRDEILAMAVPDLEAVEAPQDTARHIERIIAQGSDLFESLHHRKDGTTWPVEVLATFWSQQGDRFFVFVRDITRRRAAEMALKESEQRFRTLFDDAPVGHALNRLSDGWFLSVNPTFAAITGHTIDELNALSYWDLTPREYADQEAVQLASLKTLGKYGPYEKEYIHKDGRRIPVVLNGSLVTDPDGTQLILSVVSDITQRRQHEHERESLIQSLQDAVEEVRSLSGLLPICSSCKKIRNDGGYWQQIEAYLAEHTEASFTHGICPDCAAHYFPGTGSGKAPKA